MGNAKPSLRRGGRVERRAGSAGRAVAPLKGLARQASEKAKDDGRPPDTRHPAECIFLARGFAPGPAGARRYA